MNSRWSFILLLVASLLFYSAAPAAAVELDKPGMSVVDQWWQPALYPSVEAAIGTIQNLRDRFCQWNGAAQKPQLSVDAYGMRITAYIEGVTTGTQWVPNTGGYWVGGKYVPYYGGSTVVVNTPYSDQYSAAVDFSRIKDISVQYYPNLSRDNKWGVVLQFEDNSAVKFRGDSETTAQQLANAIATLAIARGKNLPTYLGFSLYPEKSLAAEQQHRKNLKWLEDRGAVIVGMTAGSPAHTAGLQADDIVVRANGEEVSSGAQWLGRISEGLHNAAELKLDVEVVRAGNTLTRQFTLRSFNAGGDALRKPAQPLAPAAKPPVQLGVNLRVLTPDELTSAGLSVGLRILSVDTGSIAAKSDLRPDDILVEVNGKKISDLTQLRTLLTNETPATFKVVRDGASVALTAVVGM